MTPSETTLARLADAATPGPWENTTDTQYPFHELWNNGQKQHLGSLIREEDANFIAAANPSAIKSLLARVAALETENSTLKAAISDPAAVWINILRGTIARPRALDHYEECKAAVERLEGEVARQKSLMVRVYNSGYIAGHNDTVESCYVDILDCDMDTYHAEVMEEINAILGGENSDSTTQKS